MWSPKTKVNGDRNKFYDYMTETQVGDVVFSFAKTKISFIGIVTGHTSSSSKPIEFNDNDSWNNDGWLVPVEFYELKSPLKPKDYIQGIKPHLPKKYSPLQGNGNGNQCVYLAEVHEMLANELSSLLNGQVDGVIAQHKDTEIFPPSKGNVGAIDKIRQRADISELEKLRLIKSRNGQGIYKDNLRDVEAGCRITGLTDIKYLIASHIKPWSKSNDSEKLDGNNGLLLSPHIDKLFDSGLISFDDDGSMLCSTQLNHCVLELWSINRANSVGGFNSKQKKYLQYHRKNIFKP